MISNDCTFINISEVNRLYDGGKIIWLHVHFLPSSDLSLSLSHQSKQPQLHNTHTLTVLILWAGAWSIAADIGRIHDWFHQCLYILFAEQ